MKKSQPAATNRYMRDKHTFRVFVTNDKAALYKAAADATGQSINQFIIGCIDEKIEKDRKNGISYEQR